MRGSSWSVVPILVPLFLLGSGPCSAPDIPENLDALFQGDPAIECARWQGTITDIYMTKMGCSGDYLEISPREVKYRGVKYNPVLVEWDAGFASRYVASLEQKLAPLVHGEGQFRDAESGEDADLFDQGFVERQLFGKRYQIQGDPPLILMGADFKMAEAAREYDRRKKAIQQAPDTPDRRARLDELASNGPIQQALLPLGRALAEKCQSQLYSAQAIAELAKQRFCGDHVVTDPFLRAIFGEQRLGQAVTIVQEARAHEPHWYDSIIHPSTGASPSAGAAH